MKKKSNKVGSERGGEGKKLRGVIHSEIRAEREGNEKEGTIR